MRVEVTIFPGHCTEIIFHRDFTTIYSLPSDRILDWSKLKAFADDKLTLYQTTFFFFTKLKAFAGDKLNIANIINSPCDRVENTVGKEENAGYIVFQSLLLEGR